MNSDNEFFSQIIHENFERRRTGSGVMTFRKIGAISDMDRKPEAVGAVLYFLHHLPDVKDGKKYEDLKNYLDKNCSLEEMERYRKAVNWLLYERRQNFHGIAPSVRHGDDNVVFFF